MSYIDTRLRKVTDYFDEIAVYVDDLDKRVSDLKDVRETKSSNPIEIVNLICKELSEKKRFACNLLVLKIHEKENNFRQSISLI